MPKCTYCGGTEWLGGPSGGMSRNIQCANPECRHWFNYCEGMMFDDLKRIEPTADERAVEEAKVTAHRDKEINERMKEGERLYNSGARTSMCFMYQRQGYTTPSHDDMNRLAGYVDALREELALVRKATIVTR